MNQKHKFYNPEGMYFVSFSTVYWLDIIQGNIMRGEYYLFFDGCWRVSKTLFM
jgi:hypothetical protein